MDDHGGCKRKPLSLLGLQGKEAGMAFLWNPRELQLRERCPELGPQPEEHGLCQLQAIWVRSRESGKQLSQCSHHRLGPDRRQRELEPGDAVYGAQSWVHRATELTAQRTAGAKGECPGPLVLG